MNEHHYLFFRNNSDALFYLHLQCHVNGTPMDFRIILTLRKVIHIPISIPRALLGMRFATHAANGVRMMPPIRIGNTMAHRKVSNPISIPNTIIAVKDIIGSVASTVPMAFRGSEPLKIKVGVHIGPHPPPPVTSIKAAKKPSNGTSFGGTFFVLK